MDYTIVTAWYDVREKENHPNKHDTSNAFFCSMEWYFDSAKLLFNKPFPMVIFTEPRFKEFILSARPAEYHSITRIIYRDYEELAYYSLFKKYEENHHKHKIHNLTQEKFTPLYKFIVNQKTSFVKDVILMNPFQTTRFAWMDMRLHSVYDMTVEETTEAMENIPDSRVKLMQMSPTTTAETRCRGGFYSYTRGKCAAGFFGGSREALLTFCDLCQKEFLQAIDAEMAPTDEMIYSYVIAHHPDLFEPYVGEYCDCLRNLHKARGSHHLVLPFLQRSFDSGKHDYTIAVSGGLRRAFLAGEIELSAENIHKTWYYSYVAHFWRQRRDSCRELLHEYFDIAKRRGDVAEHIRGCIGFLRDMVGYMEETDLVDRLNAV